MSSAGPLFRPVDVVIDGSQGEGGGQIVRISASLSSLLSRSVRLFKIRHARSKPGLSSPQHLAAVQLATKIAQVQTYGVFKGASSIVIDNKTESENRQHSLPLTSVISTAGATTLVLQASLPPALCFLPSVDIVASSGVAAAQCTLVLKGGTSTLLAPTSDYVINVLIPNLALFGIDLEFDVICHGFYPKGGGICHVKASKARCQRLTDSDRCVLSSVNVTERGCIEAINGRVLVCGQRTIRDNHGEICRQNAVDIIANYLTRSNEQTYDISIEDIDICNVTGGHHGDCIVITLFARLSNGSVIGSSAIWTKKQARSKNANTSDTFLHRAIAGCGVEAANELCKALESGAVVDEHMADQLCIFMGMAQGKSKVLAPKATLHLESVVGVMREFGIEIALGEQDANGNQVIECEGLGIRLRL